MKKINRIMVGSAVALLLVAGKNMADRRVAEYQNDTTIEQMHNMELKYLKNDGIKCPDQTIYNEEEQPCEQGDVDYNEPIYNGVERFNSSTQQMEQCTYLYDADANKTYFEIYECDEGDDVYQYNTKDDTPASKSEVAALTNYANY